jgi:hypothetical protein
LPEEIINLKPPEGMRTVLLNNKPVGYVRKTGNNLEDAQLANQLLIEKGLRKEILIARSIFSQATSFADASNLIFEKNLKSFPRNPQGITPFVVNAAFSAELYLKCLHKIHGDPSETHSLTTLFCQLPNKTKDRVNKLKKSIEGQYEVEKNLLFKDHLKPVSNAFINWRYIYEKNFESVNIESIIFVLHVLHEAAVQELGINE